jgi:hypothetical protein
MVAGTLHFRQAAETGRGSPNSPFAHCTPKSESLEGAPHDPPYAEPCSTADDCSCALQSGQLNVNVDLSIIPIAMSSIDR